MPETFTGPAGKAPVLLVTVMNGMLYLNANGMTLVNQRTATNGPAEKERADRQAALDAVRLFGKAGVGLDYETVYQAIAGAEYGVTVEPRQP